MQADFLNLGKFGRGAHNIFAEIGKLTEATGSQDFVYQLTGFLEKIFEHDAALAFRFLPSMPPDLLCRKNISRYIMQIYRNHHYSYDPLYESSAHWRRSKVASLESFAPLRNVYYTDFLRRAKITDELGLYFPGLGGACIGIFVERANKHFSDRELALAEKVYPLFLGLYRTHLSRFLSNLSSAQPTTDSRGLTCGTLLLDARGQRVFCDSAWRYAEKADSDLTKAAATLLQNGRSKCSVSRGKILHMSNLDETYFVAPSGKKFTLERLDIERQKTEVQSKSLTLLTPRERDIVQLVLSGYPNELIAKKLGLKNGTIKNHRRRLYDKLDITSERELILLLLRSQKDEVDRAPSAFEL